MRAAATLCLCLALLSTSVAEDDASTHAEGAHFRVVLHFDAPDLADEALQQVEALYKPAAALYGLAAGALEKKLEVHLYRDANDYEVAEEKLTGGAFKRNLAFAHHATQSAHVALQPDLSDDALAKVGLPYLTRSMLLHEAAHLVRFRAMPNFRSHPGWLGDGMAMWLKHHVLAGAEVDRAPLSAAPTVRVQALLTEGKLPKVKAVLADDASDLGFFARYDVRYLFVRYLQAKHPKAVKSLMRGMRRLGGGGDFGERVSKLLSSKLGKKDFAALDESFAAWIRTLEPRWDEVHRSLGAESEARIQIAFPSSNAIAWRTDPIGEKAYEISARVEILRNTAQQMNLLLDRRGHDFVCIALSAGYGVTLFEYTSRDSNWRRLASERHDAVVVEKPFRVKARVDGQRLVVSVNDDEVVSAELPGRAMTGPYGLGALAGSAGIWRDVAVK